MGKPFVRAVHSKGKTYFYLIQTAVEDGKPVQKKLRKLSGEEEALKLGWKNPHTPETKTAPPEAKTSVTSRKVERITPIREPETTAVPVKKTRAAKTEPPTVKQEPVESSAEMRTVSEPVAEKQETPEPLSEKQETPETSVETSEASEAPAEKQATIDTLLAKWPSEQDEAKAHPTTESAETETPRDAPPSPTSEDKSTEVHAADAEPGEKGPSVPEKSLLEEPAHKTRSIQAETPPPVPEEFPAEAFEGEPFDVVDRGDGRYILIPRWPGLTKGYVIKDESGTFCGMCRGYKCDHTEYLLHHRHPFH